MGKDLAWKGRCDGPRGKASEQQRISDGRWALKGLRVGFSNFNIVSGNGLGPAGERGNRKRPLRPPARAGHRSGLERRPLRLVGVAVAAAAATGVIQSADWKRNEVYGRVS